VIVGAVSAVTTKVVAIIGGMATLGELLPDDRALAVARVGGLVLILVGTAVLARFGGAQVAAQLETAGES
jgi:cytochrome c biogenesis protein CcdA